MEKDKYKGLTEKEIELQKLMFENKSANRISKRKKYFENKKFGREKNY